MPEVIARFRISGDHPSLPGHFPGRPLVPAVVLLQHVAAAAAPQFGGRSPSGVIQAKFLRPVFPDVDVAVMLDCDVAAGRARFHCHIAEGIAAQGELRYTGPS